MTRHWPPRTEKSTTRDVPWLGLSREEAAMVVGVGTTLFDEMVKDGRMPRPKRINGRTIWSLPAVMKAFEALPDDGKGSGNPFDEDMD